VVVQRVKESSVVVEGRTVGRIGQGLLALVGVDVTDSGDDAIYAAEKVLNLRCFTDTEGKFNLSLADVGGSVLAISQFTLLGDCRKGRRPSFIYAARPEQAIPLYERFIDHLRSQGICVETGEFGAHMDVHLINDGPVTLLIDSKKGF
jgi:D-tyrosyl-tRNA(Tyr) deacylase